MRILTIGVLACGLWSANAVAQEHGEAQAEDQADEHDSESHESDAHDAGDGSGHTGEVEHEAEAHEEAGHTSGHGHHSNHLGIFFGASTQLQYDDTGFTIGLEYERFLGRHFGLGLTVDVNATNLQRHFTASLPFLYHATSGLKLWVAPGLEFGEEEDHDSHEKKNITYFLIQMGMGYSFFFDWFSLTPQFYVDWAGGHWTLVYGVAAGIGF